jgi:hypothetical protein
MTDKTVDHSIRAHARLSASRISRVSLCPGSLLAEEAMPPEPSSAAALRGTVVHELAEHLLAGRELPEDADAELVQMAQNYVKAVRDFTAQAKKLYIELNVTPALQAIHPALGGTADLVAVGGGMLTVADLKTGFVDVDPEWNPQLLTYALGAALALKAPDTINVRLAIYQQESGGWKEWHCKYVDLLDWQERLTEIAAQALTPNAPRNPSGPACKYCKARAVCPALRGMALTIAQDEFDAQKVTRITTTMMDEAQICMTWAEAVQDAARRQLIDKPESIVGWKLRDGRKMVKWKDEKMAAALLESNRDAWTLKSASTIQKLGVQLPAGLIEETRAAASLVRVK